MDASEKPVSDATDETLRYLKPKGLEPGHAIAEFRILRELGRGGMGIVYLAHDEKLDRDVALKLLLAVPQFGPEYETRFLREARNAARLDHPNVVQVYSAGRFGDVSYMAMQFVKGKTADSVLKERGYLEPKEALRIIRDVCSALSVAHELGIVHRDIKPSNIMIEENGRARVMDFGLSRGIAGCGLEKVTQSGVYLGTPEYSSPEQCETNEIDGRSDLYSLGVVLYEMLSGRTPHTAPTPLSLFKKIMEEPPAPIGSLVPTLPKSVCALVEKMMAKDRGRRYSTAAEVGKDIDKILAGQRLEIRGIDDGEDRTSMLEGAARSPSGTGRRRTLLAACALFALALIGTRLLVVFIGHGGDNTVRKPEPNPTEPSVTASNTHETPQISMPLCTVVFDFRNTTGSKEHAWLELGVPEMLISELNQCGFLRVVTRDELLLKMREIAGKKIIVGDCVMEDVASDKLSLTPETERLLDCFGAQLVVCGSFLVSGDKVKIIAEIYTTSGYRSSGTLTESSRAAHIEHLATRDVQGDMKDIFMLVDSLADATSKAVADVLPKQEIALPETAGREAEDMDDAKAAGELTAAHKASPVETLGKIAEKRITLAESRREKAERLLRGLPQAPEARKGGIVPEQEKKKAEKGKEGLVTAGADKPGEPPPAEESQTLVIVGQGAKDFSGDTEEQKAAKAGVEVVDKLQAAEDGECGSTDRRRNVLVVQLKKLSDSDLFEITRLRWKMQKLVEDSENQEAPEVCNALKVLQMIETGENLEGALRIALECKVETKEADTK